MLTAQCRSYSLLGIASGAERPPTFTQIQLGIKIVGLDVSFTGNEFFVGNQSALKNF